MAYSIAALLAAVLSYFFFDKEIVAFFCDHRIELFRYITYLGDSAPYIVGSFLLFIFYRKKKRDVAQKALFVLSSVLASGVVAVIFKVLIGRPRPKVYLHDHIYNPQFLEFHSKFWSMPSGHTTTAFAVATSFSIIWPRYKILFFIAAALVALSRVALCKHYLSDVIVAAVLGTFIVYLLRKRYFDAI